MYILSCDDHDLFRDGLRQVLASEQSEHQLFEAASAREARDVLDAHPEIDLVLLDLGLPDADGLELLVELRRRYPTTAVAVVSAREEPEAVQESLALGAIGFIPKSATRELLSRALALIFAGGRYAPPELLAPVHTARAAKPERREGETWPLTARQREVLELLARGLTNPEIGEVLDIRLGTVKVHVARIFEALDVSNRAEAVRVFTQSEDES